MLSLLKQTVMVFIGLSVVTGIGYPLVMTGVAQVTFPHQANGSLIERDGKAVGSELIGQQFDDSKYFWSRPSATTPAYNGGASTGSNYGPTNPAQLVAVRSRVDAIRKAQPDQTGPVPVDLVTASGSGLDPHISPAAAEYQVARVARSRGIDIEAVRELVRQHTAGRQLGFLGEPRVNVLELNLALDSLHK
ncbi:MAG TPA: potassium-transporting ATPase subunit KdpC [Lacipirellulaceae bacterium]|nr:potassium-transporting ATPase subunit KdpC [Lacipirellulaceae bacterium]